MTVGSAMIPSTNDAASQHDPDAWLGNRSTSRGTKTMIPMNPKMTLGIPAKISMMGFRMFLTLLEAISERKIAAAIPRGMHITIEPMVTRIVPMIRAAAPNFS